MAVSSVKLPAQSASLSINTINLNEFIIKLCSFPESCTTAVRLVAVGPVVCGGIQNVCVHQIIQLMSLIPVNSRLREVSLL